MKQTVRMLCAVLAAVLLLSACSFSLAEGEVSVYIPSRVERLNLPEDSVYEGDPFQTGYEGAKTTIDRETVTIYSTCTDKKGNVYQNWDNVTYVATVTTTYPKGNYIRKVVAKYKNDKRNTLAGYIITYETGENETYTVTYAPKTSTVAEFHQYNADGTVDIDYLEMPNSKTPSMDLGGGVFLHHYEKDQILEGVYRSGSDVFYSGSGKQIKNWFSVEDWSGKYTKVMKGGLKPVTSFVSPRVD